MKGPWYFHPLFVFVFSLMALGTSLFLYIDSYMRLTSAFQKFVRERGLSTSQFSSFEAWAMILILSILMGIIVVGLFIIFFYYQKVIQLYRMQSNFINGFTHELKTPIASLRLFIDTLSRYGLPQPQQKKYLGFMQRDTDRLSNSVNQILHLAKLEDKKYNANWDRTDLKEFTLNWLDQNPHFKKEADITIKGDGPFVTELDRELFAVVLTNLVSNAITHNQTPRPKITIRFFYRDKSLFLVMEDNGPGIPEKEQKKIFKKFYQIHSQGKGSGIGLYTVQQIMKLHKGTWGARQKEGPSGGVFSISFPLIDN